MMDVKKGEKIINTLESIMCTDDYQRCKHKADYIRNMINQIGKMENVPEENYDLLVTLLDIIGEK